MNLFEGPKPGGFVHPHCHHWFREGGRYVFVEIQLKYPKLVDGLGMRAGELQYVMHTKQLDLSPFCLPLAPGDEFYLQLKYIKR